MPPYPIIRTWLSLATIFGVVPEAISAWKPESAPQAMVMNRNGKSFPANTGPSPLGREAGDRLVLQDRGGEHQPDGEQHDHADLHERREVVARRQQHPDRQDRGDEAVDHQAEGQRLLRQRQRTVEPPGLDVPAADDGEQQEYDADGGDLQDPARTPESRR